MKEHKGFKRSKKTPIDTKIGGQLRLCGGFLEIAKRIAPDVDWEGTGKVSESTST